MMFVALLIAVIGLALFCAWEAGAFFERIRWERRFTVVESRVHEFVMLLGDELTDWSGFSGSAQGGGGTVVQLHKGERSSEE